MALNTSRVTNIATPGVAAATARPASGSRNVASAHGTPLEEVGFAPQVGLGDNRFLRDDGEMRFGFDDKHQPERRGADPFLARAASGFKAEAADEASTASYGSFLDKVVRGIGTYEYTMRITTPGAVRPGSVMNYLY